MLIHTGDFLWDDGHAHPLAKKSKDIKPDMDKLKLLNCFSWILTPEKQKTLKDAMEQANVSFNHVGFDTPAKVKAEIGAADPDSTEKKKIKTGVGIFG